MGVQTEAVNTTESCEDYLGEDEEVASSSSSSSSSHSFSSSFSHSSFSIISFGILRLNHLQQIFLSSSSSPPPLLYIRLSSSLHSPLPLLLLSTTAFPPHHSYSYPLPSPPTPPPLLPLLQGSGAGSKPCFPPLVWTSNAGLLSSECSMRSQSVVESLSLVWFGLD